MGLLKSWTETVREVREQTGVRKVDFVDGVTPDIVEEKCPDCGKDPCECKKEATLGKGKLLSPKQRKGLDKDDEDPNQTPSGHSKKPSKNENSHDTEFDVKTAKSKMGKITVKSFDSLDDAKKHLEAMKKKGHNGLISKGGKPVKEETINEADYELYHKDFSSAMQAAYKHAKKKGFTVDPQEIDDKVATGPKKPSAGKTNRYILGTDKKKNLHVQVANLDNKKYELNCYIEQTEKENMDINDTIKQVMEGKKKWQKTGLKNAEDDPVASKNEDSDKSEPGTQGDDKEYQAKRDKILKKYGVKSCAMCATEEEKKACFNELDKAHVGDHEESAQEPGASPDDVAKKMKKAKEPQAEGWGSGTVKRKTKKEDSTLLDKVKNIMKEKKYKK